MAPCRGLMAALGERDECRLSLFRAYSEERFTCRHYDSGCGECAIAELWSTVISWSSSIELLKFFRSGLSAPVMPATQHLDFIHHKHGIRQC